MTKKEKQKVLDHLLTLTDDYWIKVFKQIDKIRHDKNVEQEQELVYLFSLANNEVDEILTVYFNKVEVEGITDRYLNNSEIADLRSFANKVGSDLRAEGLILDRDLINEVDNITAKTTLVDSVTLKIKLLLFYIYSVAQKRVNDLMFWIANQYHDRTIFEVFKAAGYGTKKIHTLSENDALEILALFWRSTQETYDDVIWRYGRTKMAEIDMIVRQSAFLNWERDEVMDRVRRKFDNGFNELENLIETDSTYYSSLSQKDAFEELIIEDAVFTAIIDERTSDFCLEADGNIIPVEDITPWVNAPPLHYYCRSTMIPIVKQVDWLTGETYEVDGDFDDWYKYN